MPTLPRDSESYLSILWCFRMDSWSPNAFGFNVHQTPGADDVFVLHDVRISGFFCWPLGSMGQERPSQVWFLTKVRPVSWHLVILSHTLLKSRGFWMKQRNAMRLCDVCNIYNIMEFSVNICMSVYCCYYYYLLLVIIMHSYISLPTSIKLVYYTLWYIFIMYIVIT